MNPSPLRYPGGKYKLYSYVSELVKQNGCSTYIEPFCGGAALAFELLLNGVVKKIIINDFDYSIYCMWKSILDNTDAFLQKIIDSLNDMFEGIAPSQQHRMSTEDWAELGKLVSIKCFSENWNNLLMWAHYADGGRGMCVEYNLALLKGNEPVLRHLYPVHYSSQRYSKDGLRDIHSEIQAIKKAIVAGLQLDDSSWLKDMMAFYLTKSSEWAYEQEWRIVVPQYNPPNSSCQLQVDNGNIDFRCVSAVYLGCKMPGETKRKIRRVINELNTNNDRKIEIHELVMEGNGYNLSAK